MINCKYCKCGKIIEKTEKNKYRFVNQKYCSSNCSRKFNIGWIKANETNKKNGTGIYKIGICSKGGKIGGIRGGEYNRLHKIGVCGISKEKRIMCGKKTAIINKKNCTGFFDKNIREMGIEINRKNKTGIFGLTFDQRSLAGKIGSKIANDKNRIDKVGFFGMTKERHIEIRSKQILPIKDTKPEIKIQNYLTKLKIEYFTHKYMNIKHAYQCDIFIPSFNLIIECDGNYWHNYPLGNPKDIIRNQELREAGYKVLRLWESEIKVMEVSDLKNKLDCMIS